MSDGANLTTWGADPHPRPDRPWASAVAIRDGAILAVGDDDEVRSASGPGADSMTVPAWRWCQG